MWTDTIFCSCELVMKRVEQSIMAWAGEGKGKKTTKNEESELESLLTLCDKLALTMMQFSFVKAEKHAKMKFLCTHNQHTVWWTRLSGSDKYFMCRSVFLGGLSFQASVGNYLFRLEAPRLRIFVVFFSLLAKHNFRFGVLFFGLMSPSGLLLCFLCHFGDQ